MLLKDVAYAKPETLAQALSLLAADPEAGVLAGGQSLVNVLKMRIGAYSTLVDINGLEDLRQVTEDSGGGLDIGALVIYDAIVHDDIIRKNRPILGQVAFRIADQQVRNRGTIGGNCCYNDPTCHFPPILSALKATFTVAGENGTRTVSADDFFVSYYQTAVLPGEILTHIHIPSSSASFGDAFVPLSAGGTDVLNVVAAAASVEWSNGRLSSVSLVVTGCGERPLRLKATEAALTGQAPSAKDIDEAVHLTSEGFDPPDDVHASSAYRRAMAPVLAARALSEAIEKARRG